ncbi:unnamed protein product [Oikopleura dioica]|uniref:Uncharacterized protein n=1 Tax=Oikopleura dioica TaxID=34765 RepID=E4WUA9_OIKDI|nr:unnamed protein product [Oikopleura dioica]
MAEDGKILTRHVFMKQKYISDIHSAVDSGDTSWLELSLAHQNNTTVFGSKGETALHRAAKKSNYQVIQKLIDHGFSPLAVGTGFKKD